MTAPLLPLSPDELINTTRAVRKRLDFTRPVEQSVILECAAAAMQAPSGSNQLTMQFVVVTDPAKKLAIAEIYRECWAVYANAPVFAGGIKRDTPEHQAQQDRVADSAGYLAEHMHEAPALVIACTGIRGTREAMAFGSMAATMGNILPATWNFMLAARARGLGTAWTTLHLMHEERVAGILGIPFDKVAQTVLFPLAYTIGTDFKPAKRADPATIVHFDAW
jgi:nitroreductase